MMFDAKLKSNATGQDVPLDARSSGVAAAGSNDDVETSQADWFSLIVWLIGFFVLAAFLLWDLITAVVLGRHSVGG
jgi:hypothetical protein